MILYDKKCNLLGMSRDVLGFLGYEDIDEFKTYANDVADLFVNKSGYVYKFQNFSWIDYILHSGAPNKNAIIKLKNGKEIESKISIEEVMLLSPIGENEVLYKIDIFNNFLGNHESESKSTKINPFRKEEVEVPLSQSIPSIPEDFQGTQEKINEDEDNNVNESEEVAPSLIEDFDFSPKEEETQAKLKFDDSIFKTTPEDDVHADKNSIESDFNISEENTSTSFEDTTISINDDFDFEPKIAEDEINSSAKLKLDDSLFETTAEDDDVRLSFDTHDDPGELEKDFNISEENTSTSFEDTTISINDDFDFKPKDQEESQINLNLEESYENEEESLSFKIDEDDEVSETIKNDFSFGETDENNFDYDEKEESIKVKNDLASDLIEEETFDRSIYFEDDYKPEKSIEDFAMPEERDFLSNNEEKEKHYLHDAAVALGVDDETLKGLTLEYIEELKKSLHNIQEAFLQHDRELLIDTIEQLKSISEHLRLVPLTEVLELFLLPWEDMPVDSLECYENIVDSL